ncbi:hypothetical protein N7454_002106 [Penicillium verhagenii]|nr:hypothetical protein N7454_002106 [Penicillium verhagenii]
MVLTGRVEQGCWESSRLCCKCHHFEWQREALIGGEATARSAEGRVRETLTGILRGWPVGAQRLQGTYVMVMLVG